MFLSNFLFVRALQFNVFCVTENSFIRLSRNTKRQRTSFYDDNPQSFALSKPLILENVP